jgi:hypothetical protein
MINLQCSGIELEIIFWQLQASEEGYQQPRTMGGYNQLVLLL